MVVSSVDLCTSFDVFGLLVYAINHRSLCTVGSGTGADPQAQRRATSYKYCGFVGTCAYPVRDTVCAHRRVHKGEVNRELEGEGRPGEQGRPGARGRGSRSRRATVRQTDIAGRREREC